MNDFFVVYKWSIESFKDFFKKEKKENKKSKRGLFSKVFGGKYEDSLSSE
jgi:hypothetical protein